jgi:hypothetical protein
MVDQTRKSADTIDAAKREMLDRIVKGAAFAGPVVASFALDGLKISKAQAQVANGSGAT